MSEVQRILIQKTEKCQAIPPPTSLIDNDILIYLAALQVSLVGPCTSVKYELHIKHQYQAHTLYIIWLGIWRTEIYN